MEAEGNRDFEREFFILTENQSRIALAKVVETLPEETKLGAELEGDVGNDFTERIHQKVPHETSTREPLQNVTFKEVCAES